MGITNGLKKILFLSLIMISVSSCGGGGGGAASSGNPPAPGPQSAVVSWDPVDWNSDTPPTRCTDLAGYRVYYSEQHPVTRNNSQMDDVGNTTSAQINNLLSGHTYYFRVSSYDTSNNESDLSVDEVSKIIN